jgi:glycosyltransferase involved in cell wall biosynthesis
VVQILRILIVSILGLFTGGTIRSLSVIDAYQRMNIRCTVIPPPFIFYDFIRNCPTNYASEYSRHRQSMKYGLEFLHENAIIKFLNGHGYLITLLHKMKLLRLPLTFYMNFLYSIYIKRQIKSDHDIILNHHELLDTVVLTALLRGMIHRPSITVLQSPPYYADRKRWACLSSMMRMYLPSNRYRLFLKNNIFRIIIGGLLKTNSKLLAVSPSVFLEMGHPIDNRHVVLNPSVPYNKVAYSSHEKTNQVIFFGRLVPEKGIIDLIHVWNLCKDRLANYRLVVYGTFYNERINDICMRLIDRLDLKATIELRGFSHQTELFPQIASSKCFIYPSHHDAFPLAILESLMLGTPVIAYDAPGNLVYENVPAVFRVKEGDYNTMAECVYGVCNLPQSNVNDLIAQSKQMFKAHESATNVASAELREITAALKR